MQNNEINIRLDNLKAALEGAETDICLQQTSALRGGYTEERHKAARKENDKNFSDIFQIIEELKIICNAE